MEHVAIVGGPPLATAASSEGGTGLQAALHTREEPCSLACLTHVPRGRTPASDGPASAEHDAPSQRPFSQSPYQSATATGGKAA